MCPLGIGLVFAGTHRPGPITMSFFILIMTLHVASAPDNNVTEDVHLFLRLSVTSQPNELVTRRGAVRDTETYTGRGILETNTKTQFFFKTFIVTFIINDCAFIGLLSFEASLFAVWAAVIVPCLPLPSR